MNDIQKKIYIDKEKQTNKWRKKNKLCAHTITRQARTTSSIQYYQWYFVTNYTDKNESKCLFNNTCTCALERQRPKRWSSDNLRKTGSERGGSGKKQQWETHPPYAVDVGCCAQVAREVAVHAYTEWRQSAEHTARKGKLCHTPTGYRRGAHLPF